MAAAAAMTAAATMFPGIVFASEQEQSIPNSGNLDWKKGPCRFCGVGCGILVGVDNGKAVAVKKSQQLLRFHYIAYIHQ